MNKEDVIIGIHCDESETGGRYNVLASFNNAIIKGFNEAGVKALSTKECYEKEIKPNLAIALNVSGLPLWQNYLNQNITNVMWCVDSLFYQNFEIVQQFASYKNFVLFNSCAEDIPAIAHYFPGLLNGYIPGGVDLDFWKKEDVKKEYDITFFGSIEDYDVKIEELRSAMPELVFKLMMEICDLAISTPELSLWSIYQLLKSQIGLELDITQYNLISKNISYIITYKQRVKMIQSLKDFDVTIFGEGPWEKYISGNIKLVKGGDVRETVHLMNKSKITLHSQPFHLAGGLHDRIINASAVETPVLTALNSTINAEFGSTVTYCNGVNYDDIAEKAEYLLTHEDERLEKAKKASEIVKAKHKWSDRARSIIEIMDFQD